jgi:hypothetical protein
MNPQVLATILQNVDRDMILQALGERSTSPVDNVVVSRTSVGESTSTFSETSQVSYWKFGHLLG